MRHIVRLAHWVSIVVGLNMGADALLAETSGNPYLGITNRNIFRLQSLQREPPIQPPPLAKVKLAGITTLVREKQALLKLSLPAVPPEPTKEVSCILTVGQQVGPVEVLAIDETAGSVRIKNSGIEMELTLIKDSPRPHHQPLPSEPPPLPMQSVSRR